MRDFIKQARQEVLTTLFEPDTLRVEVVHVNNGLLTPSVRLTHLPTSVSVTCEEFDSQSKNALMGAIRLLATLKRMESH